MQDEYNGTDLKGIACEEINWIHLTEVVVRKRFFFLGGGDVMDLRFARNLKKFLPVEWLLISQNLTFVNF